MDFPETKKEAFMSCIEIALMKKGGFHHNLVVAKLNAHYNTSIMKCYENPEYLRAVLKEVYKEDYNSVVDLIKLVLDDVSDIEKEKAKFLKVMKS